MCDKEGKPHFYDCKDGPVKAITRLADNERTRDNELLEIMPFVDPESAAAQKINIIQVLKLVDYCLAKRTAPTSQREPAQGQP